MKKVLLLLLGILLLTGCQSHRNNVIHEKTVYGEMPVISVSEQEKEENMKTYASYLAITEYLPLFQQTHKESIESIFLGDLVDIYIVDNGELRKKASPYLYPILINGQPWGVVIVYNGKDDINNVNALYGGLNPFNIGEDQMCGYVSHTSYARGSNQFYSITENLDKKFVIYLNEGKMYLVLEDKTLNLQEHYYNQIKEATDDQYSAQLREILKENSDYHWYPLDQNMKLEPKAIHIVNNVISDEENENRVAKIKEVLKNINFNESVSSKVLSVGQMFNSWQVIFNTDLSISVIRDCDISFYPIYHKKELYSGTMVYDTDRITFYQEYKKEFPEIGKYLATVNPYYCNFYLTDSRIKELGDVTEFIILRNNMIDYNSVVYITKNGIVTNEGVNVPEIYNAVIDQMKGYINQY